MFYACVIVQQGFSLLRNVGVFEATKCKFLALVGQPASEEVRVQKRAEITVLAAAQKFAELSAPLMRLCPLKRP